jgi:hypothetical protein
MVLGSTGFNGEGDVELAVNSPLAANDSVAFAVAEDGRTLVTRPLGAGRWRPVTLTPAPRSIGGLALARDTLYIADTEGAALYRLTSSRGSTPAEGGTLTLLHQGAPLRRPRELALAGLLLVADDQTRDVHGIPQHGGTLSRIHGLSQLSKGPVHLAGSEDPGEGHVIVSVGEPTPSLFEARLAGPEVILRRPLLKERSGPAAADVLPSRDARVTHPLPEKVPGHPGPLTLRAGIVYVVDTRDGALYAFPRESGTPVRIVRLEPSGDREGHTARVAVTAQHLLELDAGTRSVVERPRLVPAELVLRTESLSETLALWYTYLHRGGLLPTRKVPLERNVETTLRKHEALLAPWVPSLGPVMCALNEAFCVRGTLRLMREGDPVRIPDLPLERFVSLQRVQLNGKTTLGERVDELVGPDFAEWRTEETLQRLNPPEGKKSSWTSSPVRAGGEEPLRSRRLGSYVVPGEAMRYLAAVPAADLPPAKSGLQRLTRYEGASIRSLEERRAQAYWAEPRLPGATEMQDPPVTPQPSPPPTAPDVDRQIAEMGRAFALVTAGWSVDLWLPRPVLIRPHVAVVEEYINRNNPVFKEGGDDAFALDRTGMPELASSAAPGEAGLVVRDPDKADHGTGVAWLIGGRRSAFGAGGIAPTSLLFGLPNNLPDLIRKLPEAVAQRNVHVINISASWREKSDQLSQVIDLFAESALFVVAAGNNATTTTDGQVCAAISLFPACWGDRKNVVVVTATNREGTALLAPVKNTAGVVTEPGANWSPKDVHVAAPGEGFHVPGANAAYVPARGSSFATPLVTATAALLYAQGVQRPSLIKQRILATADPVLGPAQYVEAGVLNVGRALRHPFATVLRATRDAEETPVVVIPGQEIVLVTRTGDRRPLSLDSVRRLHKHGRDGLWRIAYATGKDLEELKIEEDLDFTDEANSIFRFFPLAEVTSPGPETRRYWVTRTDLVTTGKLVDYVDFVGPAVPSGR